MRDSAVPPQPEGGYPWPLNWLAKEWPTVKKHPTTSFVCIAVGICLGALAVWRLYETFLIPGKDATIQSLNTNLDSARQNLQRLEGEGRVSPEQIHHAAMYDVLTNQIREARVSEKTQRDLAVSESTRADAEHQSAEYNRALLLKAYASTNAPSDLEPLHLMIQVMTHEL